MSLYSFILLIIVINYNYFPDTIGNYSIGLAYPGGMTNSANYSTASLASASLLYSGWFSQSKSSQLFGLHGK